MIRWTTAFIDLPPARFDAAVAFWEAVTGASVSAARGDAGEFATLVPEDGDAFLRVQRVLDGPGGVHIDLHADDVPQLVEQAIELGARVVHRAGHVVLSSPAGCTFCVVPHRGESQRPGPRQSPAGTCLVDQLSIDVPAAAYDAECAFWSALTGWELHRGALAEFTVLARPTGIPLRLLLQQLGEDDGSSTARAHLDLASGGDVATLAAEQVALGAHLVRQTQYWTTLTDPAGLHYCLTRRDPITGTL